MTAALAVLGLFFAAGVTVAAGEIVSRPIGLNGSADDLGRSLTPSPGAVTTVTVRRTVTDGAGDDGRSDDEGAGGSSGAPAPSTPDRAPPTDGAGQDKKPGAGGEDCDENHGDEGHDDDD